MIIDKFNIKPNFTYSIIGICKNAGKTTLLNQLLKEFDKSKYITAITSIGIDGESIDQNYKTWKPKIKVYKNNYFATTKNCIKNKNVIILENTSISTFFGDIYICKALEDTYIEIIGPRTLNSIKKLNYILKKYSNNIIIDGALDRVSSCSPFISDYYFLSISPGYFNSINELEPKLFEIKEKFFQNINISSNIKNYILKKENINNILFFYNSKSNIATKIENNLYGLKTKYDSLISDINTVKTQIKSLNGIYIPKSFTNNHFKSILQNISTQNFKIFLLDQSKNFLSLDNLKLAKSKNIKIIPVLQSKCKGITISSYNPKKNIISPQILNKHIKNTFEKTPSIDILVDN